MEPSVARHNGQVATSAHSDDAADHATAAIAALLQEALIEIRTIAYLGRTIEPADGPTPDDFREWMSSTLQRRAWTSLPWSRVSRPSLRTGDRILSLR
jgi:hypothetical protein